MKNRNKTILIVSLIVFVLFSVIALAGAALVFKKDVDTMDEAADLIVMGVVKGSYSQKMNIKEGKMVFTFTTLLVEKVIKGNPVSEVTIREAGGEFDNKVTFVPGVPKFSEGERVIVYLRSLGNGNYNVYGMSQGKFSIVKEESTGREELKRDLSGLDFVDEKGETKPQKLYLDDYLNSQNLRSRMK